MLSNTLHRTTSILALLALGAAGAVSLAGQVQGAPEPAAKPRAARPSSVLPPTTGPNEVPGQVLVRLAPGASLDPIIAYFGLHLKQKLRYAPNTYLLDGALTPLPQIVAALRHTAGVLNATTNLLARPMRLPQVTSNDPFADQQTWVLNSLDAPSLWGITVGERLVKGPKQTAVVGLLDEGVLTTHEDLAGNIDPRGFDFVTGAPYDETVAPTDLEDHGTEMSGCIAAVTNNAIGISSLPWEGVKILPCRVGLDPTGTGFPLALIVDAIYYCIQEQVDVISMSLGTLFLDDLLHQAIIDAYNQGIVLVAASGNSRGVTGVPNDIDYPARFPEVISVGAVGPFDELAFYSQGGPGLDLVAPGGDDNQGFDATRQVLSTSGATQQFNFLNAPVNYNYGQGTSSATAYASGAIATLITQGARDDSLPPTERVEAIRTLLHQTARNPFGTRTADFGFGILDAGTALQRITQYIDVTTPSLNEVTASFSEPLEATIVQPVPFTLDPSNFQVFQNSRDVTAETQITNPASGSILFTPTPDTPYSIGNNTINVIAQNALFPPNPDDPTQWSGERSLEGSATGLIPARAFRFRVQPRQVLAGLQTISIPYTLPADEANGARTDTLQFLFGGNLVRLARWLPERNQYAIFDIQGSPQDPEAQLKPPPSDDPTTDQATNEAQVGVPQPPAGLGFWARVESPTQAQLFGETVRAPVYEIRLHPGFNLIGDPYSFRVPFNSMRVRFGNEVLSIQEATDRQLMRNVLWRWEPKPNAQTPADGKYTMKVLPDGELIPWEAAWIRSFQELTLLVPRVASGFQTGSIGVSARDTRFVSGAAPGAGTRVASSGKGQLAPARSVPNAAGRETFGPGQYVKLSVDGRTAAHRS